MNLCGPISPTGVTSAADARDEAFAEGRQLVGHDAALGHLDAAPAGELDHRLTRQAVEEAIGGRRVEDAVLDEEDVGARAFGDAALPVEHEGVGVAAPLRAMFGDRADHVEARGLRARRRGRRVGPTILGDVETDALHALRGIEIARPLPGRDREMDLVVLGRNAHHFRAAPGDRPQIGVDETVLGEREGLGRVDLRRAPGNLEIENARRIPSSARNAGST